MAELQQRADEVRQTFDNEGVRHEQAFFLETTTGPLLVYAIEVEDAQRASEAYARSTLPLDLQHRQVMSEVVSGEAEVERLYDVQR